MTLLRAFARTLLASQFVVSGFKAVRDPEPLVPAAEPLVERWMPLVKKYAPEQVASVIPEDTKTLVRLNGALQLFGGLALASGKGRRLGSTLLAASLVPSTIAKYPFWSRDSAEEKAVDKAHFLKNISLLGGVLLAARDTEGKPGVVWRATSGGHSLAKDARKAGKRIGKDTRHLTDSALAEGAVLVGAAVAQTRKAKKRAAKQLKSARAAAEKQAAAAQEAAAQAAKQAKKDAKKFSKSAQKETARQIKAAKGRAGKVAKNIQLGQN
jgi:uncharacterized membrane protein YphA (DoxX/SURF4 family)